MTIQTHALAAVRVIDASLAPIQRVADDASTLMATRSFFGHVERGAWLTAHQAIDGVFTEANLIGRRLMDLAEQVEVLHPEHAAFAQTLRADGGQMVATGALEHFPRLPVRDHHFLKSMTPRADAARAEQLRVTIPQVRADIETAAGLLGDASATDRAARLTTHVRSAVATGRAFTAEERMAFATMRREEFPSASRGQLLDAIAGMLSAGDGLVGRAWQYRGVLELLRSALPDAASAGAAATLVGNVDDIAARNIAYTLDQLPHAGYQGHPDYTELGRASTMIRLIAHGVDQAAAAPAPTGILVW